MGKFTIRRSTDNQFYFVLKADNGEIILTSERYTTNQSCRIGIASVKTNAPYDSRYDRHMSSNGQYYFNLKAANGEIIGTSEMYTSAAGRDNGIESVKRNAPTASIEDLS